MIFKEYDMPLINIKNSLVTIIIFVAIWTISLFIFYFIFLKALKFNKKWLN